MNEENKRPKVTGVTVDLLYPDGKSRTIKIDPTKTEAIFFSDRAVKEIFAPFYEKHESKMPKDRLVKRFGVETERLIGGEDEVKVDKELIKKLWENEGTDGFLPGLLSKTNDCNPD